MRLLFPTGTVDHLGDAVPLAKQFGSKVVAMVEVAGWCAAKGVNSTVGFNKGGTVDLGFVKLTMTHALHSSSIQDGDKMIYGGEAAGYILTLKDGRRAYFAGDTSVFSEMGLYADIYHPQLAFLPIGDHYTMGPEEAAGCRTVAESETNHPDALWDFPHPYGRPEQLEEKLSGSGIQVLNLKPGNRVQR